jgi:hypothetical protein
MDNSDHPRKALHFKCTNKDDKVRWLGNLRALEGPNR